MMSIAGKVNINEFFSEIETYLKSTVEYRNCEDFVSQGKVGVDFFEKLLTYPVIVYVKNGTIPANVEMENLIQFLKQIIYIEDVITLIYLYFNLPHKEKLEKEFNCVLIESGVAIKKTRPLKNIIWLDFFLKRKNNKVLKSGRLDYEKLENIATEILSKNEIKSLIKKGKYFYQAALGLGLSINKTNYVYQNQNIAGLISIDAININEAMKAKIYVYECPICSKKHNIFITNIKNNKRNIEKFITYNNKTKRYEFVCDHENTEYSNIGVNFGIKKEKYKITDLDIEDKIKIFLYLFYNYYNKNGVIYSKNVSNKKTEIEVLKYIEFYKKFTDDK